MTKDKFDILDFFFDGDMIINEPKEYINISNLLTRGNYMFSTSEDEKSLEKFFANTVSRQVEGNIYHIALRIPNGRRNIQKEIKKLVELHELIGSSNCIWTVIEDRYCQTEICAGILLDKTT